GGAGHIVVGLGTALNFERMNPHLCQTLYVLNCPQVLGDHDVGAMLIFISRHIFARPTGILQQERLHLRLIVLSVWRPDLRLLGHGDQVTSVVGFGLMGLVLPATGVGTGTLIGVPAVDIARQQAAPGVG